MDLVHFETSDDPLAEYTDCAIGYAKRLRREPANAALVVMSVMKKPPSLAGYILDDLGVDVELLRETIEEILPKSMTAAATSESIAPRKER